MKYSITSIALMFASLVALAIYAPASQAIADETVDQPAAEQTEADLQTRTFRFTYSGAITELKPGTKARVWLPIASSNDDQDVEVTAIETPAKGRRTKEKRHGNELLYLEGQADERGEIPFKVDYVVTRRPLTPEGTPVNDLKREQFLEGSAKIPVDGTIVKRFFSDSPPSGPTLQVARLLYDRVDLHMKYDKSGEGWGQGDVLWACDSHRGNCSDFHSVFIALCRDLDIPAKFEIGLPLPPEKGNGAIAGYHCWAKFLDGERWVGVDISEADKHPEMKDLLFGNLPPDRVMLSTERDLILEPRQAAAPVNFLIYPYAEVDGKPYNKQKREFSFQDL